MTTVGYVRVSTGDQDPERQMESIRDRYDVDEWYADIEHGDVLVGRDGLDELFTDAPDIDVVVVDEISRFGRTIQVRDTIKELRDQGVRVECIDQGLVLTPDSEEMDMASGIMYDIYTRQAQEELRQIRRRTRQGVQRAKDEGKHVGNPPTGYDVVHDGFLQPNERYEIVNEFIREVNRGRAKRPTARYFGIESPQSVLGTSDKYWDETYVGDEEWRRRRTAVQNGDKELEELE